MKIENLKQNAEQLPRSASPNDPTSSTREREKERGSEYRVSKRNVAFRSISYRQDKSCPNYSKLLSIAGQRYIFPLCKINANGFLFTISCHVSLWHSSPPPPPPPPPSSPLFRYLSGERSRARLVATGQLSLSRCHRNRYANGRTTYLGLQPRNIHQCSPANGTSRCADASGY